MKKLVFVTFILICLSATLANAQSTSTNKPIKLSSDMTISLPPDQSLIYVYELDASDLRFRNAEERERFFTTMKDNVTSYRIDRESGKVYMVLDRDYIEKHKWTVADVNTYLMNRSTYMKDQYGNYIPPADQK